MAIKAGLDHEEAVEVIVGLWTTWKDARKDKEDIWQECLSNYLVHIDETKYENWPWRCRVADTFSQETADTIGSALRNALFPVSEDFYEIVGENELSTAQAPTLFAYMQTLLHKMKFIERLNPWCKQLAILGNAPLLLTWETLALSRRQRVQQVNLATSARTYRVKDETRTRYDGPGVEVLDAFDVVFDPSARHLRGTPFIRRSLVPKDRIRTLYKDVDLAALDEQASGKPSEPSDLHKVARAQLFGVQLPDLLPTVGDDPDQVEILELHGDIVIDGERHADILAAILNRKVLAQFDRNPFWAGRSVVWGTYDDLWFTPFGKGPLEPVRGTQQLIDTFSCQKADILNIITNGAFAYVDDGIIDPETLYLRPRAGIEVGNIANIKELHPSTNISLTYQEIEMLRARGERSTGKSRFDMGQAPGGRRTAYEASMIHQGGGSRDIDVVKHLANDVLEYVLEWMVGSVQQFKWDSNDIPNDVLIGEYHVNYLGADLTAMRQFETQQMLLFMDMAGRYPALAEATDTLNLLENVGSLFHFRKPIVKSRAVYEREQAQKQRMALAQAQQGAGGGLAGGGNGSPQPQTMDMGAGAPTVGAGA